MTEWDFDAASYLALVREEIPAYDELQAVLADATAAVAARRILDLGSGTGVTARAVLDRHPGAELVGIDGSDTMLASARALVPEATFLVQDLADPLPAGPFDLVVSAFAVHHLDGPGKADLFARVAAVGSTLALLDVVVPSRPVEHPVPLEDGVDRPDTIPDLLGWLADAGFHATVVHEAGDLAVLRAQLVARA